MKRLQKLLALLLCIILGIMQLTGCSLGGKYQKGKWINDKEYVNSSLDFVFKLPKGWINGENAEEFKAMEQFLREAKDNSKREFVSLSRKKNYNNALCMSIIDLKAGGRFLIYNEKRYSKLLKKYVLEDTSTPLVLETDGDGYYTQIGGMKFYAQKYKCAGIRKEYSSAISQLEGQLGQIGDTRQIVYICMKKGKIIFLSTVYDEKDKAEMEKFPENNIKSIKEAIKKN